MQLIDNPSQLETGMVVICVHDGDSICNITNKKYTISNVYAYHVGITEFNVCNITNKKYTISNVYAYHVGITEVNGRGSHTFPMSAFLGKERVGGMYYLKFIAYDDVPVKDQLLYEMTGELPPKYQEACSHEIT